MLVLGTCNPAGEADHYNGLYLKRSEIDDIVANKRMNNIPIKSEHCGQEIGNVVSTFCGEDGSLKCLLEINDTDIEACIAAGFVRDNVAKDLSLGYTVDVSHSADSGADPVVGSTKLVAGVKRVRECSLVRQGAREGCHIIAFESPGTDTVIKNRSPENSAWDDFDLSSSLTCRSPSSAREARS